MIADARQLTSQCGPVFRSLLKPRITQQFINHAAETIPGYAYGADAVAKSWISLQELEQLKISVGFTAEDERYLRLAGEVLGDQTKQIVEHWRSGIIAGIPHLARHS